MNIYQLEKGLRGIDGVAGVVKLALSFIGPARLVGFAEIGLDNLRIAGDFATGAFSYLFTMVNTITLSHTAAIKYMMFND